MGKYDRAAFVAFVTGLTNGKKLELTIQQATDSSGTGAKTLVAQATSTETSSPTGDEELRGEVRAEDLDRANSFQFIRAVVGTDNASAVYGGVVAVLDARHKPAA